MVKKALWEARNAKNEKPGRLKLKILEAAAVIIAEESKERLSIRRIAEKIEYSPAIIYHYFKDKGEIVARIVESGYQRIVECGRNAIIYPDDPVRTLYEAFASYARIVLESPNLFRIALLGEGGFIHENYRILSEGVSRDRESIGRLAGYVQALGEKGLLRSIDPELAAQVVWSAVFGLLSRFILEPDVSPERRELLLRSLIEVLVVGLEKNETESR